MVMGITGDAAAVNGGKGGSVDGEGTATNLSEQRMVTNENSNLK